MIKINIDFNYWI